MCELSDEVTGSLRQQNTCLTEHIKFLQQVGILGDGGIRQTSGRKIFVPNKRGYIGMEL